MAFGALEELERIVSEWILEEGRAQGVQDASSFAKIVTVGSYRQAREFGQPRKGFNYRFTPESDRISVIQSGRDTEISSDWGFPGSPALQFKRLPKPELHRCLQLVLT